MSTDYYSYAGDARGRSDPDDIYAVNVNDDGQCEIERCDCTCDHFVIMWSGQEYSKNHTWISACEDDFVSLEDAR
jgi:hypothetical protein